jgi:hypothetical protein
MLGPSELGRLWLMATKAQAFRTQQQRAANPPKRKRPKRARRDGVVDTSKPGVSATDRKAARRTTRSLLAGRRGGAALEDVPATKRSRKSTRKSSDRTKRTTNQQLQAIRTTRSPSARAARSKHVTGRRRR